MTETTTGKLSAEERNDLLETTGLHDWVIDYYIEIGVQTYDEILELDNRGLTPMHIQEFQDLGYPVFEDIVALDSAGITWDFINSVGVLGYRGITELQAVQKAIRYNGATHHSAASNSIANTRKHILANAGELGPRILAAHLAPYRTWKIIEEEMWQSRTDFREALARLDDDNLYVVVSLFEELDEREAPNVDEAIGYTAVFTD